MSVDALRDTIVCTPAARAYGQIRPDIFQKAVQERPCIVEGKRVVVVVVVDKRVRA
jgi:hypothetical protein